MSIITKIEIQKKNKERVNIYIDEEFAFAVSAELIYKHNLKVKSQVDYNKLKIIADEENKIKCRYAAIRIIERFYKTEKELKEKLFQKGYDEEAILSAIEFLREYNYINDNNYTKSYVTDKIKSQGQKKILYDLKRKGVDEELIKATLSNVDEDDEIEVATSIAEKKYNILSKRENDSYKLNQKLFRYLLSKGYTYEIAKKAITNVTNNEL